jgi:hypothetical protein
MHRVIITFNRKNVEITSGASRGVPMLPEMRWRTLWQVQAPTVVLVVSFNLVVAFSFLAIGRSANNADVRVLAQACAWFHGVYAAVWLLSGPIAIRAVARLLRQAEAD